MTQSQISTTFSALTDVPLLQRVMRSFVTLFEVFFRYREIWGFLALQDIKSRFRRSSLGVFWIVAQQLAFAVGGGMVWSAIFGISMAEFIPFIASGFAIWGFLSLAFVEGCNTFIMAQGFAKQVALPMQIYIWRHVASGLFTFAIGIVVALLVIFAYKGFSAFAGLHYLLIGLILITLIGVMVTGTMAYMGAIFGDLAHGMASLFTMLFVISPVIYPPSVLISKGLGWAVSLNPLSALLEIVRVPLVDQQAADFHNYVMAVVVLIIATVIYLVLDARIGRRIVYYL